MTSFSLSYDEPKLNKTKDAYCSITSIEKNTQVMELLELLTQPLSVKSLLIYVQMTFSFDIL